ncbi:MAG: efflux RND transporter periplasmic adaptor subunit [Ignavibacteriae bacterium]|nr:efflux RND transporter periplasmic adaptor subunit [Ignavibacteriota bacterium]MCB9217475.1 efflux RND transporter periplasmic adaptor subunit [Ignavibacteria bacterium]
MNKRIEPTPYRYIATMFLLSLCALFQVGCQNNPEGEEHRHDETHAEGGHAEGEGESNHVEVTPTVAQESGIETDLVKREKINVGLSLPGIVRPEEDRIAHVGTIVPGRVVKLYASEGTFVSRGTTIAEIETLEIGKTRAEYLNAKAREEQTRRALERQERLAGEQIGAERALEGAKADYDQAVAARQEAEAHLKLFGIEPTKASASFANRMKILAPISGTISNRLATLGEFVDLADNLYTIVNTSTVWIEAKATPAQAASLTIGSSGSARAPSGEKVSGRVTFIAPLVDPESKTVTVRFSAPNPNGTFRPGTFVTTEFAGGGERSGVVVPADALERSGGKFYLYRVEEPNHFERVEVDVEEEIEDRAVIRAGVTEGDRIAVKGVFYLRSIHSAGELSEHHH